jgi:hypothetical protein
MASTYVNDLRLNEMATGDASGTWGDTTNTNLELIGEALGYGTEAITTNADTHTSTVADGATDPVRAMYVKYTGSLDSACTITIAPNTINRMQFIENGTSGSQNIIISQGSGANVTIPPGDVKAVYLDGAGSGAAVTDAFASLSTVDLKVQDDLTVTDDASVGGDLAVTGALDVDGATTTDGITNAGNFSTDGGTIKLDGNYPTGTGNVALGDTALDTVEAGGTYNTAIGHNAATAITTGDNNTSIGALTMDALSTGEGNTGLGYGALSAVTTSSYNTAVGEYAGVSITTGASNVAIGRAALSANTTASNNTAVGSSALLCKHYRWQ